MGDCYKQKRARLKLSTSRTSTTPAAIRRRAGVRIFRAPSRLFSNRLLTAHCQHCRAQIRGRCVQTCGRRPMFGHRLDVGPRNVTGTVDPRPPAAHPPYPCLPSLFGVGSPSPLRKAVSQILSGPHKRPQLRQRKIRCSGLAQQEGGSHASHAHHLVTKLNFAQLVYRTILQHGSEDAVDTKPGNEDVTQELLDTPATSARITSDSKSMAMHQVAPNKMMAVSHYIVHFIIG